MATDSPSTVNITIPVAFSLTLAVKKTLLYAISGTTSIVVFFNAGSV